MLTYVFDESGVPLYEQAYRCIKNDIISGNLRSGEKLPSKRTFADNNGISTITIQNAYDQLISEGDRKSTRLNSSHSGQSRMPSSA